MENRAIHIKNKPDGYDMPDASSFWASLFMTVICFLMRRTCRALLYEFYMRNMNEKISDPEVRAYRAIKGAEYVYQTIYFMLASAIGYYAIKDLDFLPKSLGGTADGFVFHKDYPYPPRGAYIADLYFCGNLGYHIESILNGLKSWRNPEFIEFALHHLATVVLIVSSFYFGYSDIGITVFFLHDFSDIFTPLTKSCGDLKWKLRYVTLPVLIVTWCYFRLILFG